MLKYENENNLDPSIEILRFVNEPEIFQKLNCVKVMLNHLLYLKQNNSRNLSIYLSQKHRLDSSSMRIACDRRFDEDTNRIEIRRIKIGFTNHSRYLLMHVVDGGAWIPISSNASQFYGIDFNQLRSKVLMNYRRKAIEKRIIFKTRELLVDILKQLVIGGIFKKELFI